MDRIEFLKIIGSGTVLACTGCLNACAPDYIDPAPTNIDFTLDLSQTENVALTNNGGSMTKNGVIVARINAGEFIAISQICTHATSNVAFQSASSSFLCPSHGSRFDKDGAVVNGPASKPLHKYNTKLTGTNLRVFS
jgi:cytochrome b6-f complex iron-sulfur subunit